MAFNFLITAVKADNDDANFSIWNSRNISGFFHNHVMSRWRAITSSFTPDSQPGLKHHIMSKTSSILKISRK